METHCFIPVIIKLVRLAHVSNVLHPEFSALSQAPVIRSFTETQMSNFYVIIWRGAD